MDSGRKILVVEDNEINRMILASILEEQYPVLLAENGKEALNIIEQNPNEIGGIITDLMMPVMDGYQFLEEISHRDDCKNIPILVATGEYETNVERRCLELGAWDFVQKPFDPVIVFMRIRNNMERRKLHLMEKQKISDTLERYLDPSIAAEVLKDDDSSKLMRGRNVEIVVLYVDIRGFTALSENMKPEQVVEVLNDFLAVTSQCIKRYGGTVDKFIGDCVMAFWGAPLPCEDAAYKACCAAMEMIAQSDALSERLSHLCKSRISYGIGIHAGPAVVGNIGTMERMDYTAIGDTVNIASRLESSAPPEKIYITRIVADRLGDRAETTSLGRHIYLKGKASKVGEVLTLDSIKGI